MELNKSLELLDFDAMSPNTVIIVKIPKGHISVHPQSLALEFAALTERHQEVMKEKNISFFLVDENVAIDAIPEKQMNEHGWFKKS